MLDRYGNPIEKIYPMTRDLINQFDERFETVYHSKDSRREIMELLDKLYCHERISNYIHIIEKDGHYGVYHELFDTMLLPAIYDYLAPIGTDNEPFYIACQGNKYGIVKGDVIGTVLLPLVYDKIEPLGEFLDLFVFEQAGHQGIITSCYGRFVELHPAIYDSISQYPDTPFVLLCKEGKKSLWRVTLSIPTIYDDIFVPPFFGWIKVKYQDKWGYIDRHAHFTDNINEAFLYHDAERYFQYED